MDLIILTSTLDRSAAAVTSATNMTAVQGPDAFPQLVIGTHEPLSVSHYSAASTVEVWSYDPAYTVTASLGNLTPAGIDSYAEATLSTVIPILGKSGIMALTTERLTSAMGNLFSSRLGSKWAVLTLQITVTDPSGNKRVFAQLPVTVRGTVPTFTQT